MKNYEDRIVLFLDILGFKNIINETIQDGKEIEKNTNIIINSISTLKKDANIRSKFSSKEVTQFSDSIIVSFRLEDKSLLRQIFYDFHLIIANLLFNNMLCRGAISYGKIYHKNNIVFGPALIDAYNQETKAAIYPRIIIDESILEIMKKNYFATSNTYAKITFNEYLNFSLCKDTDEKYFIEYLLNSMMFLEKDDLFKTYHQLKEKIIKYLKSNDESVKIKFGWLKNQYNKLKEKLCKADLEEEVFFKRPDILKFYQEFKKI